MYYYITTSSAVAGYDVLMVFFVCSPVVCPPVCVSGGPAVDRYGLQRAGRRWDADQRKEPQLGESNSGNTTAGRRGGDGS